MLINEKNLNEFIVKNKEVNEMKKKLEERVREVLKEMWNVKGEVEKKYDYLRYLDYKEEEVSGSMLFIPNCSCCGDEYKSFSFPTYYLFHDNWKEELKEQMEREKQEAFFEEQRKEEERKQQVLEREKQEWERLNQKFGQKGEDSK